MEGGLEEAAKGSDESDPGLRGAFVDPFSLGPYPTSLRDAAVLSSVTPTLARTLTHSRTVTGAASTKLTVKRIKRIRATIMHRLIGMGRMR